MARATVTELTTTLEQLQAQMLALSQRIEVLEGGHSHANGVQGAEAARAQTDAPKDVPAEPVQAGLSEEELLAISAAIGAYLGVRAHIRQIRLVSTNAWAQQGRVSIQASHRLQG